MALKDTDDAKPEEQEADVSLDMSQAAVKKMIADARERGYITYEQLTREMDHTIRLVLDHVGAHVDVVPPPTTKSQSDALNAEWAERFVSEHPEHAHRRSIPRTN